MKDESVNPLLMDIITNHQLTPDEPENCKKEYVESVCEFCEYIQIECASHPSGCHALSAEKKMCEWGHWKDDF